MFSLDLSALNDTIVHYNEQVTDLYSLGRELRGIASHAGTGWQGEGYEAFRAEVDYVADTMLEQLTDAISSINRLLRTMYSDAVPAVRYRNALSFSSESAPLYGDSGTLAFNGDDASVLEALNTVRGALDAKDAALAGLGQTGGPEAIGILMATAAMRVEGQGAGVGLDAFERNLHAFVEAIGVLDRDFSFESPDPAFNQLKNPVGLEASLHDLFSPDGTVDYERLAVLLNRPLTLVTAAQMDALAGLLSLIMASGSQGDLERFIGCAARDVLVGYNVSPFATHIHQPEDVECVPFYTREFTPVLAQLLEISLARRYSEAYGYVPFNELPAPSQVAFLESLSTVIFALFPSGELNYANSSIRIPVAPGMTGYYEISGSVALDTDMPVTVKTAIDGQQGILRGFSASIAGLSGSVTRTATGEYRTFNLSVTAFENEYSKARVENGIRARTESVYVECSVESGVSGSTVTGTVGVEQRPGQADRPQIEVNAMDVAVGALPLQQGVPNSGYEPYAPHSEWVPSLDFTLPDTGDHAPWPFGDIISLLSGNY